MSFIIEEISNKLLAIGFGVVLNLFWPAQALFFFTSLALKNESVAKAMR